MKTIIRNFSNYIKLVAVFLLVVIAASVDYYSFYERTRKIEILEELNDKFDTVRVSIIKLEYTLDMFIVARRFEETTVALIKHDIARLDKEFAEIITNPKYFDFINGNIMLSDGLVSVVEDWQIVRSEIGSLSEASTQAEVMLIHNAVDLNTILIQEVSDSLVKLIIHSRNELLLEIRSRGLWTIGGFVSFLLIGIFFLYNRVLSKTKEGSLAALMIKSTEDSTRFAESRGILGSFMSELNSMLNTLKADGESKLLEIEQLEGQLRERTAQVVALTALNNVAASSLSQDELFDAAVAMITECGGAGATAIYLDDEHGLRLKSSVGMGEKFSTDGTIIPQFIKNSSSAKENSVTIYDSMDEYPNERFGALVRASGFNSMVSVPIQYNGTLLGYIFTVYLDRQELCKEDLPFLEAVSSLFGAYMGFITRFRGQYDVSNFLETLINQLPFGVAVFDKSGTCHMINSTHKRFLDPSGNDKIVGNFRVFEDDILVNQGMVAAIKKSYDGYTTEFNIRYNPGDIQKFNFKGLAKKLRIRSIPLYDSGGEISKIALLYEDIAGLQDSVGGTE